MIWSGIFLCTLSYYEIPHSGSLSTSLTYKRRKRNSRRSVGEQERKSSSWLEEGDRIISAGDQIFSAEGDQFFSGMLVEGHHGCRTSLHGCFSRPPDRIQGWGSSLRITSLTTWIRQRICVRSRAYRICSIVPETLCSVRRGVQVNVNIRIVHSNTTFLFQISKRAYNIELTQILYTNATSSWTPNVTQRKG